MLEAQVSKKGVEEKISGGTDGAPEFALLRTVETVPFVARDSVMVGAVAVHLYMKLWWPGAMKSFFK